MSYMVSMTRVPAANAGNASAAASDPEGTGDGQLPEIGDGEGEFGTREPAHGVALNDA